MLDIQKNPFPAREADRAPAGTDPPRQSRDLPANRDVEAFRSAMDRSKPEGFANGSDRAALERPDELFRGAGGREERTGAPRRHDLESGEALQKKPSEADRDGGLKGSDFIDAMFGRARADAFMPAAGPRAEGAQAAPSGFPDGDLEALVSRILVSSPEKGSTEVRLTLSDAALRGTEVTLLRDAAGALSVKIVAADPRAFQTLVASRGDLVSALEAQEPEGVTVVMEDGAGANDTRQRSRGLDAVENHE